MLRYPDDFDEYTRQVADSALFRGLAVAVWHLGNIPPEANAKDWFLAKLYAEVVESGSTLRPNFIPVHLNDNEQKCLEAKFSIFRALCMDSPGPFPEMR